jgi:Zn-dependent M16 (insulinase) family peptidase
LASSASVNVLRDSMILTKRGVFGHILLAFCIVSAHVHAEDALNATNLANLKENEELVDFRVANLFGDAAGHVVGVKLWHIPTGAPVFLLQMETVPQVFMWVDAPPRSNQGLAHALEHLLAGKGTKGRYSTLLRDMRLSASNAATTEDFNYYSFSSGAGLEGFFEQFHAWLDALFRPDFTDTEAEREFYHLGIARDPGTKKKTLIEQGTVYDEMQSRLGKYDYYYAANRQTLGEDNPFGFDPSGDVDEMRGITPEQIRQFYGQYYHLGPTTGFVFVVDPKEELIPFLSKISKEFQTYSLPSTGLRSEPLHSTKPKYAIHPSQKVDVRILHFPTDNELVPGEILFSWRPVENSSAVELRLLRLFLNGLGDGDQSLLHAALVDSKTRELESGATGVDSSVSLKDSPFFPVSRLEISGIPGTKISEQLVNQLRSVISGKVKEISQYPDGSDELLAFNKVVSSEARAQQRSEIVWTKSPPLFGVSGSQTPWKDHFEVLELDPGFVRSLSEDAAWSEVAERLRSNRNIWREIILEFHLLDLPYAAASVPSRKLLADVEAAKRSRLLQKTKELMDRYHTSDDQEALSRFDETERSKTEEIDRIGPRVARPTFTNRPPLTPDDDIRYQQFRLADVPVIASIFERPPTIDIGLSFDLSRIPKKYYRLLPLIPRCLDSLGLRQGDQVVSYSDLRGQIEETTYEFSIKYPLDIRSKTSKLEIRASASDATSFRRTLDLIRQMMRDNYLEESNADRLRDIVAQNISSDDLFVKQPETSWIYNPVLALRRRDDPAFMAVSSHFTRAHSNARMQWLLHKPVTSEEIARLRTFAGRVMGQLGELSREEISQKLQSINASGLKGELIEYWRRNLFSFPEVELIGGLKQLSRDVQEDLRTGPLETVGELKELQALILDRGALQIDLTVNPSSLNELRPDLIRFLESVPYAKIHKDAKPDAAATQVYSATGRRSKTMGTADFPTYLGLVTDSVNGDAVFVADFPGYSQLDQQSLEQVLASTLLSGAGPSSFYMRTWEAGLAYSNGIAGDPDTQMLTYYADRSPNLSALIQFVLSTAKGISTLRDDALLDYVFSQTFSFSRVMLSPSRRGQLLARDIRDGVRPEKVRRFSEAILALREKPDLLKELKQTSFDSICDVLMTDSCVAQQRKAHSIFFFIGSETVLSDTETRLSIPRLVRLYPRDYWMN